MTRGILYVVAFISIVNFTEVVHAAGPSKNIPVKCPNVVGIKATGDYLKKKDLQCFSNAKVAESDGYLPFSTGQSSNPSVAECPKPSASASGLIPLEQIHTLEGARIIASNGQFLGILTRDSSRSDSISNPYSAYGNSTSPTSIFNPSSLYGGQSVLSPYSKNSQTPPSILIGDTFAAYLTSNKLFSPRVNPSFLPIWINLNDL